MFLWSLTAFLFAMPLPGVRFANFIEADIAVTALHIGRLFAKMGGAYVFQAIGLGTALPAFYSRFV